MVRKMLELESPRWHELTHAYGKASDIPALLEQLKTAPPRSDWQSEPWFSLWSALCHQSDVHIASYAAVPHVVALAAEKPLAQRIEYANFVGAVEAFRHRKNAPAIPDDLAASYYAALKQIASLILECLEMDWDELGYRALLGSLASVRGQPNLGMAIMEISGEGYSCPKCEADIKLQGYDSNDEI
jgi:hypothetical protein